MNAKVNLKTVLQMGTYLSVLIDLDTSLH